MSDSDDELMELLHPFTNEILEQIEDFPYDYESMISLSFNLLQKSLSEKGFSWPFGFGFMAYSILLGLTKIELENFTHEAEILVNKYHSNDNTFMTHNSKIKDCILVLEECFDIGFRDIDDFLYFTESIMKSEIAAKINELWEIIILKYSEESQLSDLDSAIESFQAKQLASQPKQIENTELQQNEDHNPTNQQVLLSSQSIENNTKIQNNIEQIDNIIENTKPIENDQNINSTTHTSHENKFNDNKYINTGIDRKNSENTNIENSKQEAIKIKSLDVHLYSTSNEKEYISSNRISPMFEENFLQINFPLMMTTSGSYIGFISRLNFENGILSVELSANRTVHADFDTEPEMTKRAQEKDLKIGDIVDCKVEWSKDRAYNLSKLGSLYDVPVFEEDSSAENQEERFGEYSERTLPAEFYDEQYLYQNQDDSPFIDLETLVNKTSGAELQKLRTLFSFWRSDCEEDTDLESLQTTRTDLTNSSTTAFTDIIVDKNSIRIPDKDLGYKNNSEINSVDVITVDTKQLKGLDKKSQSDNDSLSYTRMPTIMSAENFDDINFYDDNSTKKLQIKPNENSNKDINDNNSSIASTPTTNNDLSSLNESDGINLNEVESFEEDEGYISSKQYDENQIIHRYNPFHEETIKDRIENDAIFNLEWNSKKFKKSLYKNESIDKEIQKEETQKEVSILVDKQNIDSQKEDAKKLTLQNIETQIVYNQKVDVQQEIIQNVETHNENVQNDKKNQALDVEIKSGDIIFYKNNNNLDLDEKVNKIKSGRSMEGSIDDHKSQFSISIESNEPLSAISHYESFSERNLNKPEKFKMLNKILIDLEQNTFDEESKQQIENAKSAIQLVKSQWVEGLEEDDPIEVREKQRQITKNPEEPYLIKQGQNIEKPIVYSPELKKNDMSLPKLNSEKKSSFLSNDSPPHSPITPLSPLLGKKTPGNSSTNSTRTDSTYNIKSISHRNSKKSLRKDFQFEDNYNKDHLRTISDLSKKTLKLVKSVTKTKRKGSLKSTKLLPKQILEEKNQVIEQLEHQILQLRMVIEEQALVIVGLREEQEKIKKLERRRSIQS